MQSSVRRTIFGTLSTSTTCRTCRGEGVVITSPCHKCSGKKIVRKRKKIKVKIPAGINSGNHLRLHGLGNSGGLGARSGDLYVVVVVEPHKFFRRDKNDIFLEVPISFSEAALGATIEAPTLKDSAKIKIPPATQSGTVFRLKGHGIPDLGGSSVGDEYVKVILKTPKNLSKKQKELLEELGSLDGKEMRQPDFFDHFKKHFK